MRFVRLAVFPDGGLHPIGGAMARAGDVRRIAIQYLDTYSDGTGVLLYRVEGRITAIEEVLDRHRLVRHVDVFRAPTSSTEEGYCYAHVERGSPACELVDIVRRHDLIVETPLEFRPDGGVRVLLAGRQEGINRAFQSFQPVTDFEVLSTGEYDPVTKGVMAELTGKQQAVLRTAVNLGYYAVPKQATHTEIAAEMDCATSTVDEHLRKAESTVFDALLR